MRKQVTRRELRIPNRLAQKIALALSIDRALDVMWERQARARLGGEATTKMTLEPVQGRQ